MPEGSSSVAETVVVGRADCAIVGHVPIGMSTFHRALLWRTTSYTFGKSKGGRTERTRLLFSDVMTFTEEPSEHRVRLRW